MSLVQCQTQVKETHTTRKRQKEEGKTNKKTLNKETQNHREIRHKTRLKSYRQKEVRVCASCSSGGEVLGPVAILYPMARCLAFRPYLSPVFNVCLRVLLVWVRLHEYSWLCYTHAEVDGLNVWHWRGVSWATAAVLNTIGQSVYIQQQEHAQTTLHYTWVGRAHSWSMGGFRVFQRVPFIFSKKVFFRGVAACIGLSLNCLDRYLPLSYKAVVLKLFFSGPTAPTKI